MANTHFTLSKVWRVRLAGAAAVTGALLLLGVLSPGRTVVVATAVAQALPENIEKCAQDPECCPSITQRLLKEARAFVNVSCADAQRLTLGEIDTRLREYEERTCQQDGFDLKNTGLTCLLQARMRKSGLGNAQSVDGRWGAGSWKNAECAVKVSHGVKSVGKAMQRNGKGLFESWLIVKDGLERDAKRCGGSKVIAVAAKQTGPANEPPQPASSSESDTYETAETPIIDKPQVPDLSDGGLPLPRRNPLRLANVTDDDQPQPVTSNTPSGACLPVKGETEPDISRNKKAIIKAGLCLKKDGVTENGRRWSFDILTNPNKPDGPYWAILHDNENSAFDAAVYAVAQYGGGLIAVDGPETRIFNGQDPNRNFGTSSADAKHCVGQRAPSPKYVKTIMRHLRPTAGGHYFALHSNSPGFSGDKKGGKGHISAARPASKVMRGFMTKGGGRGDNAVLVAGVERYGKGTKAAKVIGRLRKLKLNVIYEHVRPSRNDCSLSNYLLLKRGTGLGKYFNIEVVHGDTATQRKMIDTLLREHLKIRS